MKIEVDDEWVGAEIDGKLDAVGVENFVKVFEKVWKLYVGDAVDFEAVADTAIHYHKRFIIELLG